MPDLSHLRDQWRMSRVSPILRSLGKKSLLEFLRNTKKKHEDILSDHFKTAVTIDRIERHLVKNIEFSVDEDDVVFDFHEIYAGFSTYRKQDKIFLTFWR